MKLKNSLIRTMNPRNIILLLIAAVLTLSVSCDFRKTSESSGVVSLDDGKYSETSSYDDSVLSVIQGTPEGELKTSDRRKEIYVVFNHPIVPLSALEEETKGVFTVTPSVKGKFRWYGSRICAFIPDEGWASDTEYTVKIPGGLKSLNSRKLAGEYKFSFRVEAAELGVWCSPSKYNTIDYDQSFSLRFNYPVKKSDLAKYLTIKSGGREIPYTLSASSASYSYYDEEEQNSESDSTLDSSKIIIVKPQGRFDRGGEVVLNINDGLRSINGEAAVFQIKSFDYKTHGPLDVTFKDEGGYYQELWKSGFNFSNYVDMESAAAAISFSPRAELRETPSGRRKSIGLGEWSVKAGQTYKITVGAMTDLYGNRFNKPFEVTVRVPDYYPEFSIESYMNLLEAEAGKKLPVEIVNIQKLGVGAGVYSMKELQAKLAGGYRYSISDNIQYRLSEWQPGLSKNQSGRFGYDASKHLSNGKYGWMAFRFTGNVFDSYKNTLKEQSLTQVVQSTNLAVAVKEDPFTIHAWVSNLSDGAMRKGINLTILDSSKEIGSGVTDGTGYCAISKKGSGLYDKAIFLATDSAGDRTYLTTADNELSMWGLANYSSSAGERQVSGEIIFDRKLYRPGDEVHFKGILVERYNGTLQALKKRDVVLSVDNSSGDNVYKENLKTSEQGGVWGSWKIPSDAPLGHYQVSIEEKNSSGRNRSINDTFQVEEFRPVAFTVGIEGLKDAKDSEKLSLTIEGSYLFGAPMGNAPVSWSLSRSRKTFSFDRYSGFTFGDNSYWVSESSESSGTGYFSGGEGKLNGAGRIPVEVALKPMSVSEKSSKPEGEYMLSESYNMSIEATVKDVDDKSVTKTETFSVFPGSFLIGIKLDSSYQIFNSDFSFDLVAVTNSGDRTSGKKCDVRIMKNTWKSVKAKGPEGSMQTRNSLVKEVVFTREVTLSSDPMKMKFRPSSPGIYTITVQESGGGTYARAGIYAYGGGFSSWDFNDDDSVTVIPDKSMYNPGDTAKVLIQSPFKNCRAIITLERETIFWRKTITLDGKGTPVSVPITEEHTPNVYLSVMIVRPRIKPDPGATAAEKKSFEDNDLGVPKLKAGVATLNVNNSSKRAKLDISTDKESYSPGENIKLRIKTEPGAEVALSVADRGVLDLINYMYRDPLDKFYSSWPLGVRIFHNMNMIIRQYKYALKGGSPGGGDDDGYGDEGGGGFALKDEDGTRSNIRYTAYWNPKITADSSGNAEVSFRLPDNLTTFRIMALAAADGKYRDFRKEFKVRKAMVIQKSVPRFIRAGDKLMTGGVIINQTGIEGEFRVSIESDLLKTGTASGTVLVKPGEAREVLFPVSLDNEKYSKLNKNITDAIRSGQKGLNRIINVKGYLTVEPVDMSRFARKGFAQSDVKDRLMFEFPVKEYPVEEAFAISGFTDSSSQEMIRFPSEQSIFPEFGGLTVNLSSTALVGLNRGFEFYKSNPYFCLEQRASAFLLMVSSGQMLREFSFRPPDEKGYDFGEIEKLFLNEIGDFRNSDGGFRLWKERGAGQGDVSDPYLTAYIVFALITAKDKGYDIDNGILSGAVSFLKKYMKEPYKDGYSYILESLSFINYTSALTGNRDESLSKLLLEKKDQLSLRGHGFLALSLIHQRGVKSVSGDSDVKRIMDLFKNSMEITTRKVMFKEQGAGAYRRAFYTEGSTLALILQCFMRVDGGNPLISGMVQHIVESRGSSLWGDTHSIAFLALALQEYRDRYEKNGSGDITAKVLINSREVFSNTFKPATMALFSGVKSFDELYAMGKSGTDYPLVFSREGAGRVYYTASLQYFPSLAVTPPRDEGIEIRRTIHDLSTADEKNRFGTEVKTSLKRGEVYLCRIIVVNPKPYYNAVIVDPIPSSVEIMNTAFSTEKQSLQKYESKSSGSGEFWWSYSEPVIEYRDDMVVITENYLYPGMHEYTYLIRPVVRGESGAPSSTAKLMYEPEVFGRTGNMVISVK